MPLYDLVLAPPTAGPEIAASSAPLSSFTGFTCKPIDHVKLATLSALLGISSFEAAIGALDPSIEASPDGPWVSELPSALLDRVADLGFLRRRQVASDWGSTEEFKLDRIGAKEARDFLGSLAALWEQGRARGERIFLWSSL